MSIEQFGAGMPRWWLVCDRCGERVEFSTLDPMRIRGEAQAMGWICVALTLTTASTPPPTTAPPAFQDVCPACQWAKTKRQPKEGNG